MSQFEKLLNRFKSFPKDFTYDELKALLKHLGFTEMNRGKTTGSAVCFYREKDERTITIHKPHPEKIVKRCYLKQIYEKLNEYGEV